MVKGCVGRNAAQTEAESVKWRENFSEYGW